MNKNDISLSLGLLLLVSWMPSILGASADAQTMSQYENSQMGITFEYPTYMDIMSLSCFESNSSGCGISLLFNTTLLTCDKCDKGLYAGSIAALKLNESFQNLKPCNCHSLMDFVRWDHDRMAYDKAKAKLIKENETKVGHNYSARQMEIYQEQDNNTQLIIRVVSNNLGYIFTYSYTNLGNNEYGKYLSVFKDILKSVKFTQISTHQSPPT